MLHARSAFPTFFYLNVSAAASKPTDPDVLKSQHIPFILETLRLALILADQFVKTKEMFHLLALSFF